MHYCIFDTRFLTRRSSMLVRLFAPVSLIAMTLMAYHPYAYASTNSSSLPDSCGCVIFRIDDIQGSWNNVLQEHTLQIFIDKGIPATLGMVMQPYGDDKDIVDIVRRGNNLGLFDLALHGWKHVDYTTLSFEEQHDTLGMAQTKFEEIHGFSTAINIMPYNRYNNDTLAAMKELHLTVVSADKNMPIGYVAQYDVTSIPDTQDFKDKTNEDLVSGIRSDIEKYGYSMILLHAHEFRFDGQDNVPNKGEFQRLSDLIDIIKSEGIPFATLTEMVFGEKPPRATLPIPVSQPVAENSASYSDPVSDANELPLSTKDNNMIRADDNDQDSIISTENENVGEGEQQQTKISTQNAQLNLAIILAVLGMVCWIFILHWIEKKKLSIKKKML